ncbi:hypothetical protein [Achromobacter xylosoxidans]|uniref:hypothetical protein n=1 Tax=Alcaligenes xylosoxydans xylosoxydans TaxID=85698 RepID=UPI0038FBFB18
MTNSYDVAHGLSQCPPGPLEPVELAQQPGAAPATGNTARDQEMYVAGIRTGEENAKHNAAIRAGVPDGWKLVPIEPTDAMLDTGIKQHRCEQGDPWYSSPDLGEGDCRDIYAAMLNAAPAAPGVSTVEDAGAQKEAVMDAIADALGEAYDCTRVWHAWSYGTMGPDDFALVAADPSRVAEIATAAIAAMRPAPAAGDAQPAVAPEWINCESRRPWVANGLRAAAHELRGKEKGNRTAFNKDFMGLPSRYMADAYAEAAAVFERRLGELAAQRKGDA